MKKFFLIFLFLFFLIPHSAQAFYLDAEDFDANSLSAVTLDLTVNSEIGTSIDVNTLLPGDSFDYTVDVAKTDQSSPAVYQISYSNSSNPDFCQQFNLKINSTSGEIFNNPLANLSGFTHPDFLLNSSTPQSLVFHFSLPSSTSSDYQNQTCNFNLVFTGWQDNLPNPSNGFVDTEQLAYSFSSTSWPTPVSNIINLTDSQSSFNFDIEYEAENNVDYVELWYSHNLEPWTLFGHDHPNSPGTFHFTSPRGDGVYRFYTLAVANNGATEPLTDKEAGASYVVVDTISPVTGVVLSDHFASQELLQNGNFEDPTSLANWNAGGSGDHQTADDSGNTILQIGNSTSSPSANTSDYVYQIVSVPSDSAATLNFRYNFFSQDVADYDQFNVYAKSATDEILSLLWHAGNYTQPADSDYSSGWTTITQSLSGLVGQTIKLWFEVANSYDDLHPSWAQVDDIHLTAGDNNVLSGSTLTLAAVDPTGAGLITTTVKISDSDPVDYTGPITITSDVGVSYWSTDGVGNTEAPKSIDLKVKDTIGQIVFDQFIPNPGLGLDKVIKLYNTQTKPVDVGDTNPIYQPVDVSGWQLCHATIPVDTDPSSPNYHPDLTPDECVDIAASMNPPDNKTTLSPESELLLLVDINLSSAKDKLFLRNKTHEIIDSYGYENAVLSIAYKRNPVGTGAWSDPTSENNLLSYYLYPQTSSDKVKFKIYGMPHNGSYELEITYLSNTLEKGIFDSHTLSSSDSSPYEKEFFLGTCSTGGACTVDPNISQIKYVFTITNNGSSTYQQNL